MNPIEENDSLEFLDFVRYRKRPKSTKTKRQLRTLAIFSHKAKSQKQNEDTSLVLVIAFIISLKKNYDFIWPLSWGPFLERPGNLSGPKSNSWNYYSLVVKSCFFNIFQIKEGKITAKFQSLNRVLVEDTKGFISPEKFRDVRETGRCKHKQLINCHFIWFLSYPETMKLLVIIAAVLCGKQVMTQTNNNICGSGK